MKETNINIEKITIDNKGVNKFYNNYINIKRF